MADSPQNDTFRVITGGGFDDVTGASLDETIGVVESRPGTRLSPAACIDSYMLRGAVRFQKRQTPTVRGTKGSLVIGVLEIGGTSGAITATDMVASEYHFNGNTKPHEHEQHYFYDAAGTENIAPISAS